MKKKIQIIVLAAGHGKRMNHRTLPKVLIPFRGQPIIAHLLDAIRSSGVDKKPVIVVGQKADQVKAAFGPKYTYVFQRQQLGTGHAVACCQPVLEHQAQHVMVLYGDHPLLTASTISRLGKTHLDSDSVCTMATVKVTDFRSWRSCFKDWGRVIRGADHRVTRIVECKDATPAQKRIKEVNPSLFCFQARWLWQNIGSLKNTNSQRELYLTDLVEIAISQKLRITTVPIAPRQAPGINTMEQLKLIKSLL